MAAVDGLEESETAGGGLPPEALGERPPDTTGRVPGAAGAYRRALASGGD